jgi:hypothetical protein
MNTYQEKYRGWMMAVTFAEAGEWDTARAMIPRTAQKKKLTFLERAFMAVAFAEGGMADEAIRIMEDRPPQLHGIGDFLDAIGLRGVPVTYAVLAAKTA